MLIVLIKVKVIAEVGEGLRLCLPRWRELEIEIIRDLERHWSFSQEQSAGKQHASGNQRLIQAIAMASSAVRPSASVIRSP
jgi:hypothetical protein